MTIPNEINELATMFPGAEVSRVKRTWQIKFGDALVKWTKTQGHTWTCPRDRVQCWGTIGQAAAFIRRRNGIVS